MFQYLLIDCKTQKHLQFITKNYLKLYTTVQVYYCFSGILLLRLIFFLSFNEVFTIKKCILKPPNLHYEVLSKAYYIIMLFIQHIELISEIVGWSVQINRLE